MTINTLFLFEKYKAMRYAYATTDEMRAKLERDSGLNGKAFECAIKSYIAMREILAISPAGEPDFIATYNGKPVSIEIKTGCCKTLDSMNADIVIYAPELDLTQPLEWQAYIFTKAEWSKFLNGYTGRGQLLKNDYDRHIQSFRSEGRPNASAPIREYIDTVCFDQPILEDELDNFGEA